LIELGVQITIGVH